MSDNSHSSRSTADVDQLDSAKRRELHRLCGRAYDEVLTEEDKALLDTLLSESRAARALYFQFVELHTLMLAKVGIGEQREAEALRQRVSAGSGDEEVNAADSLKRVTSHTLQNANLKSRANLLLSLAALLLLAVTVGVAVFSNQAANSPQGSTVAESQSVLDEIVVDAEEAVNQIQLSYMSPATQWLGDASFGPSNEIPSGQRLQIGTGEIELTYASGTKLLLVGPAEFLVEPIGGQLYRGGLVASVSEEGHGFTITTPSGKVVDLGTEFGVAVDDFGLSEVSVFQGKVEAFHNLPDGRKKKHELTKGRGLQWNEKDHQLLDADLRRFAASVLDQMPSGEHTDSEGRVTLVDKFRQASLDHRKWKVLGDVNTTVDGLRLNGDGTAENLPYVISSREYDPSQGPISVTCDFRFVEGSILGPASLSVLTRSVDQRGVALGPSAGVLASCARCSLEINANDPLDGVLLTGIKMESDREVSHLSGSRFHRPLPNATYRLVVQDDGVNVTLTVSLRDNPSISKTVTCRSLFRGGANHIAIEGALAGSVIVDEVRITQDLAGEALSSYADFTSMLHRQRLQTSIEQEIFKTFVPTNGKLVLEDDFEDEQLNQQLWNTLGETRILDGAVQLGLPNDEGRINTWKARPYLITQDEYDPGVASLTILGKITFADNFLNGYGASFAVMTRADRELGQGPGWEYSILRQGMRANFWPAAWNSEHSLEIHEKPSSNTITLLATQGAEVDPKKKSYLFQVIDDGSNVALTIVDPLQPKFPIKISSPTNATLRTGHIGFESCWGSPILLDDIRIYQNFERSE